LTIVFTVSYMNTAIESKIRLSVFVVLYFYLLK